jgi:hypothetical protein
MVRKRNVPSFQSKTSLDPSTAMTEIDGLTIIFIDFMFQRSHHDSNEVKLRCSFLKT